MPLFGKKKEERKSEFELPEMPSMDETSNIKRTIGRFPEPETIEFPELPPSRLTPPGEFLNENVTKASIPEIQREQRRPIFTSSAPTMPSRGFTREIKPKFKEPLFIKIDKFREAVESLEIVNKRIQELNEVMTKIKETRAKEEEEISKWEKEIREIKDRLLIIDQKLFSKIE